MSYIEDLQQNEWLEKRTEILAQDEFKCRNCSIERSKFRGLVNSFGIKSYEELMDNGYSFINKSENDYCLKNVNIIKDGWITPVVFLVENMSTIKLNELNFAMQNFDAKVFGKTFKTKRLIAFQEKKIDVDSMIDLNVHHRYYIVGNKPWEYPNDALVTLCHKCHKREHENNTVFVYDKDGNISSELITCSKCNGSGYINEFNYFHNGICFKCGGEGVIL